VIEPLFTGEDVLRFHEIVRQVFPSPRKSCVTRCACRGLAPASERNAGFRQRMGQLGRRHARRPIPGPGREGPRAPERPRPRHRRGHPNSRSAHTPHRILLNYRAEAEGMTVEAVHQAPPRNPQTSLGRRLKAVTIQLNHEWTRIEPVQGRLFQRCLSVTNGGCLDR